MSNTIGLSMITLSFFVVTSVNGQNGSSDSICWSTDYILKWSDFQGVQSDDEKWEAVSFASIDAQGYMDRGLPNYKVFNCFLRKKSWTTDTVSMDLLEHEQLHFDIAELYARKIKKAVEELRKKKLKTYDRYEPVIYRLLHERQAMDVKYDKETLHSMNVEKQKEWCKKISKELDELKKYASDKR